MDNIIEKLEYKNCLIEIYQDEFYNEIPTDWEDENLFLVGWNSREFWTEKSVIEPKEAKNIFGAYIMHEDFTEYKQEAKKALKKYWIFGVDAYIHGGISLSLHGEGMRCRWDTSDYIGAIFADKKEFKTSKKAEKAARELLNTWNDILSGNVYGFITENKNGEVIDSCSGFIGDFETSGIIDEAKSSIDYYVEQKTKKHLSILKAQIKNRIAIEKRKALII